jgi:hypothetical protein
MLRLPPYSAQSSKIKPRNFRPQIENPPASAISGGGYIGDGSLFSALAQPFPHAKMRMRAADSGATTDFGVGHFPVHGG